MLRSMSRRVAACAAGVAARSRSSASGSALAAHSRAPLKAQAAAAASPPPYPQSPRRQLSTTRAPATSPPAAVDAVIVGAGIVGCSIALELARRGWSTVNIDVNPGAGLGSTSYSSGIIRCWYSVPHSVQVAYEGYLGWTAWEDYLQVKDERGTAFPRTCGGMVLRGGVGDAFLARSLPCMQACGVAYEEWDTAQVEARFPYMDLTSYWPPRRVDDDAFGTPAEGEPKLPGAVYFPDAGYVSDPMLATQNLEAAARHASPGAAQFVYNTKLERVRYAGGRVAGVEVASRGSVSRIDAPVVINATGPHSREVTNAIFADPDCPGRNDMSVSTVARRVEVAHLPSCEGVTFAQDGMIVSDFDAGIYFRPEVGGKIVVGSQEPHCDEPFDEFLDAADSMDSSLSDAWTNVVYRLAQRIPRLEIPGSMDARGIVAMYDQASDWSPIYDASSVPGLYMAIGTSGNQFKNAPVIGHVMSEIVTAAENGNDQDATPVQVTLPRSGAVVNTAPYSRKRAQLATSGTVLG